MSDDKSMNAYFCTLRYASDWHSFNTLPTKVRPAYLRGRPNSKRQKTIFDRFCGVRLLAASS